MTDDFTHPGDIELAQASGEAEASQEIVAVVRPPDGGEIILPSLAGTVYDLRFDPRLAQVRVLDVDGDGDLDVVLVFNAGTAEESRIIFKDMVAVAQGGNPPLLQIGEAQFGSDTMVEEVQALAGERLTLEATLETAAAAGPELLGTGATQYDDNLGTLIDFLDPQGVIPPVERTFSTIRPDGP